MEEIKEYIPTEEEKDSMDEFCRDIIQSFQDNFNGEDHMIEKMAFCLTILMKSFEESFGIILTAIIDKEDKR